MGSRKQRIKKMRESMEKLGEDYDVPDPDKKMEAKKKTSAEKRRKEQIKKKKRQEKGKAPFSVFGLAKKIKERGRKLRETVRE